MFAARYYKNPEGITLLLEKGAVLNAVDKLGRNALLHALEGNNSLQ